MKVRSRADPAARVTWRAKLAPVGRTLGFAAASAIPPLATPARAADAGAPTTTVVVLAPVRCASVRDDEVRRLAGIELGSLLAPALAAEPSASSSQSVFQIEITCDDGRAKVDVRAAGAIHAEERTLVLDDFPGDAAPRALALAGVELLAAQAPAVRAELGVARARGGAIGVTANAMNGAEPVPSPTPGSRPSPTASLSAGVAAIRRAFLGANGATAWGGHAEVVRDSGERLRLLGDVELTEASATAPLGEARATSLGLGLFAGLRGAPTPHVALSVAAGVRANANQLRGTAAAGSGATTSNVWRPTWGPALTARASAGSRRVAAAISLELGMTALGAEAQALNVTVLALRGVFWTAALGLEL